MNKSNVKFEEIDAFSTALVSRCVCVESAIIIMILNCGCIKWVIPV